MKAEEFDRVLNFAKLMLVADDNHSIYWRYYIKGLIYGFWGAEYKPDDHDETMSLRENRNWGATERYGGYIDGLKKATEIIPFTII